MARPLRIAFPGASYHVSARGNERKTVFNSIRDRQKFLEYFETASERYNTVIHAYCLLDNHYHLLLGTPSANLPQIMQHINGAYTT
jgi:putative transposase